MSNVGHRGEKDPSPDALDVEGFEEAEPFSEDPLDDYDEASWDDEGDEDGDQGDSSVEKRKARKSGFLSFNTIVIAIAVVFGGGFVLMQLSKQGGSSSQTQSVAPVSRLQMTGMQDNPVFKDVREEKSASVLPLPKKETGLPSTEMPFEKAPSALPSPLPEISDERTSSSDVLTPLPSGALPEGRRDVADPLSSLRKAPVSLPSDEKVESGAKLASPLDLSKTGARASVPAVPVTEVEKAALPGSLPDGGESLPADSRMQDGNGMPLREPEAVDAAQTDALRQEISRLSDRLSGIETKIEEMAKKGPQSVASVPVSKDPEVAALKESLSRLEKTLASVRSETVSQEPARPPVKASVSSGRKPERKTLASSLSSEGKRVKTSTPPQKTERQAPPVSSSPSPRWEIRSIQPGVAWVAPAGENDMQSVSVGDSLPGLGVIRRISVVDGAWVIEGTSGRLRQ